MSSSLGSSNIEKKFESYVIKRRLDLMMLKGSIEFNVVQKLSFRFFIFKGTAKFTGYRRAIDISNPS